jgi:hypothetical protein
MPSCTSGGAQCRNFSSRINWRLYAAQLKSEETMRFEIGSRVKWKESRKIRLGFALSDHGKVVGVQNFLAEDGDAHFDIEFDNGDVVHGIAGDWIEKISGAS